MQGKLLSGTHTMTMASSHPLIAETELVRVVVHPTKRRRVTVLLYNHTDSSTPLHSDELALANAEERARFIGQLPTTLQASADTALRTVTAQLTAWLIKNPGHGNQSSVRPDREAEEVWPEPVNGESLLSTIVVILRRYVVMSRETAHAIALWILHTYASDVADFTPYILITSPVRECGKTTLLDILEPLVHRPRRSDGMTAAALYRSIDRDIPTILLDELDTRLGGDGGENLRGVLNSGFKAGNVYTICVGDSHEVRDFKTFCPKVLAGIGRPWDTVVSRSIPVRLQRATKSERTRLRKVTGATIHAQFATYRRQCVRWAIDHREELTDHRSPDVPEALSARQADIWRPLFAIADLIGDRWPARARVAAQQLHGVVEEEGDYGLLLLEDIRTYYAELVTDRLRSMELAAYLSTLEHRPWPEMPNGKPLSPRALAKLLGRFGIKPTTFRDSKGTGKGYLLEHLAPAFARYLKTESVTLQPSGLAVTSVTPESQSPVTDVTAINESLCDG